MKRLMIAVLALSAFASPATWVAAGSGSEACVTHCSDAASENNERGTSGWSAFFNGCMLTCWMK